MSPKRFALFMIGLRQATRCVRAALFLLLLAPTLAHADGGTVQFKKTAGPYTVTLFGAPVPLRSGPCDLSVLIQKASDPVLDAQVFIVAGIVTASATREQATDKLLYAATVVFPSGGTWPVKVLVGDVSVTGDIVVIDSQPPFVEHWPYFALVPLAIILFVINQRLKLRRRAARP